MSFPDYPIYVINLERSKHRWDDITQQMERCSVDNYERIDAYDGFTIADREERNLLAPGVLDTAISGQRKEHDQHNFGSIGCYISHMRAWQRLVDSGQPYGLICEDDVMVYPSSFVRFDLLLEELPKDWKICVAGVYGLQGPERAEKIKTKNFSIMRPSLWTCLSCYFIKRQTCIYLLSKAVPIKYQVDWFVSRNPTMTSYLLESPIVGLSAHYANSDIQHTPVISLAKDDKYIVASLVIGALFLIAFQTGIIIMLTKKKNKKE